MHFQNAFPPTTIQHSWHAPTRVSLGGYEFKSLPVLRWRFIFIFFSWFASNTTIFRVEEWECIYVDQFDISRRILIYYRRQSEADFGVSLVLCVCKLGSRIKTFTDWMNSRTSSQNNTFSSPTQFITLFVEWLNVQFTPSLSPVWSPLIRTRLLQLGS